MSLMRFKVGQTYYLKNGVYTDGHLSEIRNELIDFLGFSHKHPQYYFDIKKTIENVWALKIIQLDDNFVLPSGIENKEILLPHDRIKEYEIQENGEVLGTELQHVFRNHLIQKISENENGCIIKVVSRDHNV